MSASYEELLKSLEAIDNEQAAPGEDTPADNDNDDDGDADDTIVAAAADGDKTAADDKKPFGKSLQAVDANGDTVEAIDATELVKSLVAKQDEQGTALTKALTTFTSIVKKQGDVIKSLQADINKLRGEGRGRKTVLTVLEKPGAGDLTKSAAEASGEQGGLTKEAFFAKANAAFDGGKITGHELTAIDVALRSGQLPGESIINKVMG